jgi:hypothetical protein
MIRPTLERAPHFVGIAGAIVNASNASLVATDVIEHCLDDVRLNSKLSHSRCASPAKIV